MTEPITSPDNEKLKLARKLADRRARAKHGLFVTEGEDLLEAGRGAGWRPESVLVDADSELAGTPVEAEVLGSASTLGSGTRAIAIWRRPQSVPQPAAGTLAVHLSGIADPGNVGTIVRSAAALCDARVVLGPGCADPYGPKALRAAMGATFAAPPAAGEIEATPRPRLGLVAHGGADLDAAIAELAPATLCLGAEREGLDEAATGACESTATIALRGSGESLNVAAAAAIALHRISSRGPSRAAQHG